LQKPQVKKIWFPTGLALSQWQLPNEADYLKLQALFQKSPWISTHATNWENLTTSLSLPGNHLTGNILNSAGVLPFTATI
jgi:hypothetical protein